VEKGWRKSVISNNFQGEGSMFAGSHLLSIDDKGRLAIPARFRSQLADGHGQQLVITMGPLTCLEIYPLGTFREIAEQIQNMEDRRKADLLKLAFVGRAVESEIDKQGRLSLPQFLRKQARLDGSAVMVGQINRFDVWAEDLWNEMFSDAGGRREDLAEAFAMLKR
jgi:MraZ protein